MMKARVRSGEGLTLSSALHKGFTAAEIMPGVFHIGDPLDVHATLLTGSRSALLFDAGYGLSNLYDYVQGLTKLPVTLLLSHGHHDHALGAMHFPKALMLAEDMPVVRIYTSQYMRECVARNAALTQEASLEYLKMPMPPIQAPEEDVFELGELSARLLRLPGHTPGSAALYIPQRKLLLTGDNWNPHTWLFFPEALPVDAYAAMMHTLLGIPFLWALTPHFGRLIPRSRMERYILGLNREAFSGALPVVIPGYENIPTKETFPAPDFKLVFRA